MSQAADVSIIIPAYRREQVLLDALNALMRQEPAAGGNSWSTGQAARAGHPGATGGLEQPGRTPSAGCAGVARMTLANTAIPPLA